MHAGEQDLGHPSCLACQSCGCTEQSYASTRSAHPLGCECLSACPTLRAWCDEESCLREEPNLVAKLGNMCEQKAGLRCALETSACLGFVGNSGNRSMFKSMLTCACDTCPGTAESFEGAMARAFDDSHLDEHVL